MKQKEMYLKMKKEIIDLLPNLRKLTEEEKKEMFIKFKTQELKNSLLAEFIFIIKNKSEEEIKKAELEMVETLEKSEKMLKMLELNLEDLF